MYSSLFLIALSASAARAQDTADPAEPEVVTAPVEIDGVVLFRVRGVSSFPAGARARLIQERIVAAAADPAVILDSLRVVERDGMTQVAAGDRTLATFVEADARLEQVRTIELAKVHLSRIREAIAAYREARSGPALRRSLGKALLGTCAFVAAVFLMLWAWRRADQILRRRLEPHIHTIGYQSFTLLRAEWITRTLESGLRALRIVALVTGTVIYLGFVLAQFPWTRKLSSNTAALVLDPLRVIGAGIVANIPSLIFLAILFLVVRTALRLTRIFFDAVDRGSVQIGRFEPEWATPTYKIIRLVVLAFALVVAYPYIPGSESGAFKGVSLFLGVVLSLGSSTAIANVMAGYMMTYRRAFKVGDRVRIGQAVGDVIETRLQVTHVRTFKNEEIIVPNSQILSSEVMNYSSIARAQGLILHTEVGIGYETPWRQVEAMLLIAAQRTPGLLTEPRPFVLLQRLGDFAVTYELNVYCANVHAMQELYTGLHHGILDVFNEYGVQIMTPAYERDPATPKVVAPRDWYAMPAARGGDVEHLAARR